MNNLLQILLFVLFAVLIGIGMIRRGNKKFKITTYVVESNKIKQDCTITVLADLHNYVYGNKNEQLLQAIRKVNPDAVISAGDMIEGYKDAKGTRETVRFLKKLNEEFLFFYGMGNHERKIRTSPELYPRQVEEFEEELNKTTIKLLDNETRKIENYNIKIYGLNLEREYFRKFKLFPVSVAHISELVGSKDESAFNVLIAHNPDQFESYVKWGADVVLSGHVHGGMIRIPGIGGVISPQLTLFPKYDGGKYQKENTTMILSRGLGNHSIHIRIFNRAELVVLKLKKHLE
jgi:predicted MPP superfamily phosphohydrolase